MVALFLYTNLRRWQHVKQDKDYGLVSCGFEAWLLRKLDRELKQRKGEDDERFTDNVLP